MQKFIFLSHEISCARCGYRGKPKLNRLHLFLFLFFLALGIVAYKFSMAHGNWRRAWGAWAFFILAFVIGRDARVYLCPNCKNVHYDPILPV